jgi:hypothetical protein
LLDSRRQRYRTSANWRPSAEYAVLGDDAQEQAPKEEIQMPLRRVA